MELCLAARSTKAISIHFPYLRYASPARVEDGWMLLVNNAGIATIGDVTHAQYMAQDISGQLGCGIFRHAGSDRA